MLSYHALKILHVSAVALSASLFLVRAGLMLRRSVLVKARWLKLIVHSVDTLLLTAALGMLWVSGRQVFAEPWLMAKVGCLLVYIGLGAMAMKYAVSDQAKRRYLVLALLMLTNIIAIAMTRNPWGLLGLIRP